MVAKRGLVELTVRTPDHVIPINFMLDVDIPALLGLDVLYGHSLIVGNVTNRL